MSAFHGGAESSGWTDPSAAWGAAPSEGYPAARSPARSGRRGSGRNVPGAVRKPRAIVVVAATLTLLAVLVAGVLLGGKILNKLHPSGAPTSSSSFVAYTPGPTPTPAPNFTYFQSKRSAYTLTYPKSWTPTEQAAKGDDNLDTFAAPGGVPLMNVEQAGAFANLADADVISSEVQSGRNQDAGATYSEDTAAATTAAIGGEQWIRHEFDVTNAGTTFRMAILSCHHHGRGYAIVLVSAPADFAKLNSGAFQTMLASFRFVA
jgi:hypothetical protein